MTTTIRCERVEARVTEEEKALIHRAAAMRGTTVGEFVATTLVAAAGGVVEGCEAMVLSAGDARAFVEALLDPPEPNAALREAAAMHARRVRRT